jgi:calcineurin-like phosphoesterase family protein
MTNHIVHDWNSKVSANDLVYHLGDVSFGDEEKTKSVLWRLNGKIILVKGNHDKVVTNGDCSARFESITDYARISIDGHEVMMFHFPIWEWDKMHRGSFHLYGHVHGNSSVPGRAMDVGVDMRPGVDMSPWSWDEIKKKISPIEIRSHH